MLRICITLATLLSVVSQNPSNAQLKLQRLNATEPGSNPVGSLPSLFPTPNGPFYGLPYNVSSTMTRPLPFTVSANCEAGKVYTVGNGSDLLTNYKTELECVFNAGLTPRKVPEGNFKCSILSVINTQAFNSMLNQHWKGQRITKMPCNDKHTYVGWNNLVPGQFAPFIATLGRLQINLAPGEYYDGKDALITDYTQDFRKACPTYRAFMRPRSNNNSPGTSRTPAVNNVYPLNQNVDALRFVGKQEDGRSIYLGKSYLRDAYRDDLQAATVAYYYITSDDENASPRFQAGDSLPPLEKSFKYILPGTVDLVLRLLPIDNIITTPVRSIAKFVQGVWRTGMNSIAYTTRGANNRGFGSRFINRGRLQNTMNSQKIGT